MPNQTGRRADGQNGSHNFYPNDQVLPQPDVSAAPPPLALEEAWVQPYSQDDEDYYAQAGALYRIMSSAQQERLAATIAGGLSAATPSVQGRILGYLAKADSDYAERVRSAVAAGD